VLANFYEETLFHDVLFKNQEETLFDVNDLSRVSFRGADITKVRFTERVVWGNDPKDRFKVVDEKYLEESPFPLFRWNKVPGKDEKKLKRFLKENPDLDSINFDSKVERTTDKIITIPSSNGTISIELEQEDNIPLVKVKVDHYTKLVFTAKNQPTVFKLKRQKNNFNVYNYTGLSLGSVLAIYRSLRENYEYRLRYDEAGQFFKREMELGEKNTWKFIQWLV
jgi:hypothetical protein